MKLKYFITLFILTLSFTWLGAQPVPADGITGVSILPSFEWTGSGAYYLQISDDKFTSVDMEISVNDVTTYSMTEEALAALGYTPLANNDVFHWRITSTTGVGGTIEDGPYHFTTAPGVTVTLSAPTNGATVYTSSAMFSWSINTAVGNMKFLLQVDQNSATPNAAQWAGADIAPAAMSNIYYNATGLLLGSPYKWRVVVLNGSSEVISYSSVYGFTTDGGAVVPTLLTPSNGTTVYTTAPTFYWNVGGAGTDLTYQIQIDDDSDCSSPIIDQDNISDLYYTIADGVLDAGQTYYWRVQSDYNGDVSGFQASAWSFDINGGAVVPTLTSPTNGATVYTETPSLYWTVNGAGTDLTYDVEIYDDAAHTTLEYSGTSSELYFTVPAGELVAGNDYFWRVQSVYDRSGSNISSGYSSDWSFDIAGGLDVTIYHSFPANGNTVYTNDPYVYWYVDQYTTGLEFQVRYAETSATDGVTGELNDGSEVDLALTTDYFDQITGLDPGVEYWWQVRAKYNGSYGAWTTPTSFTTHGVGTLLKPVNSYPADGVTIYTTAPYLYWYVNGSSDGISFDVWLRDITAAGAWGEEESNLTSLYVQIEGLIAGHTYEWKVRPGDDASFDSNPTEFTVAGGVGDGYPIVTYPLSNPTVYTATPMLNWYLEGSSLGLTGYKVKYSLTDPGVSADWEAANYGAPDATDGEFTIADISTTYWTVTTDLTYGETYYWAVASYDATGNSAWSEGSFTIVGGANGTSVVLSQPNNGSTITTTAPTLYWYLNGSSLGITSYTIDYSESDASWLHSTTSTNLYADLSGLTPGATYRWRVTPDYNGTPGTASDIWTFTVDNGSVPVQPLVGGPANNISVSTSAPMLSWVMPAKGANGLLYKVEFLNNNDTDWSNAKVVEGVADPYTIISGLKAGEYYKWRVSSSVDGNYPIPPSFGVFKVADNVTGVEEEFIPTEFSVKQNYPNPFNPTTIIKYEIAEQSIVTINIYNMLGQRIATLLNNEKPAGSFEVVWNGTDDFGKKVASGTYIYRVTAGVNTISKKMVLLK